MILSGKQASASKKKKPLRFSEKSR